MFNKLYIACAALAGAAVAFYIADKVYKKRMFDCECDCDDYEDYDFGELEDEGEPLCGYDCEKGRHCESAGEKTDDLADYGFYRDGHCVPPESDDITPF